MVFLKMQISWAHRGVLSHWTEGGNLHFKPVSWLIVMQMFLDLILRTTGLKVGRLICSFSQFYF